MSHYICRQICLKTYMTLNVDCFSCSGIGHTLNSACLHMHTYTHTDTHISILTAATVRRRESQPRGKPLALSCPSPLSPHPHPPTPSLLLPILPFLQACVMSLSPDSRHVNEDVMRLTDMQLIWFPSLPCDDASIKGHGAHKQFRKREQEWLNS